MPLETDCATPSAFLFPNFLSVWSVTSRGCFYLGSFPYGMLSIPRFGGLSWCLAFGGIQGHRYWEKMSGADNQSKKGGVKRSPFQGRHWDLRWEIIQKTKKNRRNWKWSRGRGNKTSKTKYVPGNLCHQIGKCKKQYWQKWSTESTY